MIRGDAVGHDLCLDEAVMTRRFTVKLRHATTAVLFSAATVLMPAVLSAQFTTFVAPPRRAVADSAKPAVVAAKAKADSVARMSVSDMKAWVDSAAGTGTQVASASDTTMAAANAAAPVPVPNTAGRNSTTTTFSNGAIAPNTASPLPMYVATGLLLIGCGLLLLRRRATPERIREK